MIKYLKGKRNEKGKEYSIFGRLQFEGEYLNGEINGKGKEYIFTGELKFEGEYLYSKKLRGKCYIDSPIPNPQSPIPMNIY